MISSKHASGVNAALNRALSHPLSGQILVLLTEMEASPSKLATRLGEPVQKVSYHCRQLRKKGLVELVAIRPGKRGSQEHFYKSNARPVIEHQAWATLSKIVRETNSVFVAKAILGDLAAALTAGTFDARTDRTMIRYPLLLDEEGMAEIEPASARYLEDLHNVKAASDGRRSTTGEKGVHCVALLLAFEVPTPVGDNDGNHVDDASPVSEANS